MTTQELRTYINKVLGNSIRVILPSYWWKRLFGVTIDTIEQQIDNAVSNVKVVTDSAMSDTSTNAVQNKVIKEYVDAIKPSNRTFYYSETENQELLNHNKKVFQDVLRSAKNGKQMEPVYLGLPTETGERYVIVSPQYSVEEMGSSLLIGFTNVIDHTGEYNYIVFDSGGMLKTAPPADQSTLTFVAAFDTQMNDVTTAQEKSTNKSNAFTYTQGIESGKEYNIDLKVFFRDSSKSYSVEVNPSFIGIKGLYDTFINGEDDSIVFAKLDLGDRYAGLIYDLVISTDGGVELTPHIDMVEINLLHARIISDIVTSDGLSSLALKQNQEIYRHEFSFMRATPIAVYVSNTGQIIPARLSRGNVYAGNYLFHLNSDGTLEHHSVQVSGGNIPVDSILSTASTNPVQNKVVTEAIIAKADKVYVDAEISKVSGGSSGGSNVYLLDPGNYEPAQAYGYFQEIAQGNKPVGIVNHWSSDHGVYCYSLVELAFIKDDYGYVDYCIEEEKYRLKFRLSDGWSVYIEADEYYRYDLDEARSYIEGLWEFIEEDIYDDINEAMNTAELVLDELIYWQDDLINLTEQVNLLESRLAALEGN